MSWIDTKLKYAATLTAGGTPDSNNPAYWTEEGGTPWVAIGDMSGRRTAVTETARQLTPAGMAAARLADMPAGTLLFAMYASVGEIAILGVRATWNQALLGLTPNSAVQPRFLYYRLLAMHPQLGGLYRSNTQNNLNAQQVGNLRFRLPPGATQGAIVEFLDRETARIDELIAEQRLLMQALSERRSAIIRSHMDGWDTKKLVRHARLGNGSTPRRSISGYWENGTVPWVNSSVVNLDRVTEPTEYVTDLAVAECHLPLVERGSILVALTGQGKTRGAATVTEIATSINQHLAYVTPFDSTWRPDFLLHAFGAAYEHLRFVSGGQGSTKGALTCGELGSQFFPAPPVADQGRIVRQIDEDSGYIDDLLSEVQAAVSLLQERRAALITAAVTGQIDVRESA